MEPQEASRTTGDSDRDAPDQGIPPIDFLLINSPAIAFAAAAAAAACLAFRCRFPEAIAPFLAAWWASCGAFMLGRDFLERKRGLYLRLRSLRPFPRDAAASRSLRRTPCGLAVYAAAVRYSRCEGARHGYPNLDEERGSI